MKIKFFVRTFVASWVLLVLQPGNVFGADTCYFPGDTSYQAASPPPLYDQLIVYLQANALGPGGWGAAGGQCVSQLTSLIGDSHSGSGHIHHQCGVPVPENGPDYELDIPYICCPNGYDAGTHDCTTKYSASADEIKSAAPKSCPVNKSGDPIDPETGAVSKIEGDCRTNGIGGPGFGRFYNSVDNTATNLSAGWRGSFTRHIEGNSKVAVPVVLTASSNNSSEYSSPDSACTSGFLEIQSRVPSWVGATTQYTNAICQVIKNGLVIGRVPIHSTGGIPALQPQIVSYDVVRDDGQIISFWQQASGLRSPGGVTLRLSQTASGFELRDDRDTVETYDTNGILQTITSRSGLVQTMTYDGSGRLSSVTDNFGHRLVFGYDAQNRLSTVTRQ